MTFEYTSNLDKEIHIYLNPIETGATTTLNNVFFGVDSDVLDQRSDAEISEVSQFLKSNPDVRIMIEGHTDDSGSKEYNLDLSQRRARAVYDKLIYLGISVDKIVSKGFGMSQPVVENTNSENRAKNRRIEFKILE